MQFPILTKHIFENVPYSNGENSLIKRINSQSLTDKRKESLVTALSIGAVFIVLAAIYFVNLPNSLFDAIIRFFNSLILAQVPGTSVSLPAPAVPTVHILLYNAVFEFCIGLGIIEIALLTVRIMLHSPISKKAETIGNLVFWLGASFLAITYLVNMTIISEWFVFWAGIILIGGFSLVARAFILLARR
jgi:hypothetical protein